MARLVWDEVGSRTFEAGLDRGVLYGEDRKGIAWNGLTSVTPDFEDEVDPKYYEGQLRFNLPRSGDFSGTLKAYTYPDELLEYEGAYEVADGMFLGEQAPKTFGLCYRTLIGNDVVGVGSAYKLHILYNLTATPSNKDYESVGSSTDPLEFEWHVTGLPEDAPGYVPTAHLIFDSRKINPTLLWILESTFYGNQNDNGRLMPLREVIQYTKDNWS